MIVDFHCHIFHTTEAKLAAIAERMSQRCAKYGVHRSAEEVFAGYAPLINDPSAERLLRGMDDANIDISVCFVMDNIGEGLDDDAVLEENRSCGNLAKKYPGRIIPFAGIDPRRQKAPELLKRCIEEFGMRGLKLHPDQGYSLVSNEAYNVFKIAQEYNIVILTHTGPVGPPRRNRFSHPLFLDDIGCDFPALRIVAAHSGGPFWNNDWCAVATFNDNMYGDLAEWQLDAAARYERFCRTLRRLLDNVGPNKLLFSSDWPFFEPFISRDTWVNLLRRLPQNAPQGIRFTTDEIDAILGANAKRVLGI